MAVSTMNGPATVVFGRRALVSCLTVVLAIVLAAAQSPAVAESWTRFRGPNGSGISRATTVPTEWTVDDYNWRVELPGTGHSSPVVWKDRLFVTAAEAESGRRWLLCHHVEDGRLLWQHEFPFEKHPKHKVNSFATCTPAVDAERVYVLWQSKQNSTLTALDHEGRELWQYELGPFRGGHGPGTSPIVHEDQVVVCHDHEGPSFRVGLDRRTGEERWKVERPGRRACYATPCIYRPAGGAPQVICTHSYEGITSIDPRTGRINWEVKPFGEFPQRAIGSPIVADGLIIGSSGFTTGRRNVVAVRPPTPTGDSPGKTDRAGERGEKSHEGGRRRKAASPAPERPQKPEEVYRVSRGAPHIPTPHVANGLLFLWDDRGIVTCTDAADGSLVWRKRIGGAFFSSPICVDGRIYCADREGTMVVIEAAREFQELARNSLGGPTLATPAVADGVMYLRTESHLMSLGGEGTGSAQTSSAP